MLLCVFIEYEYCKKKKKTLTPSRAHEFTLSEAFLDIKKKNKIKNKYTSCNNVISSILFCFASVFQSGSFVRNEIVARRTVTAIDVIVVVVIVVC